MNYSLSTFLLCVVSGVALAQTAVPHTSTTGSKADESDVTDSVQALTTALDDLTARVNTLEGQFSAAELAGKYAASVLDVSMSASNNSARVESSTSNGILILRANGTFSLSLTSRNVADVWLFSGHNPVQTASVTGDSSTTSDNPSGTWSVSGNALSLSISGGGTVSLSIAAGGQLFVGSNAGDDGSNALILFVRTS